MSNQTQESQRKVQPSSYAVEAARQFSSRNDSSTITEQKILDNDNTMVTVVCITYNHEDYIAQALDSFIMQKTDFKFKVFVGDDCSPDRTAEIIQEYAEKYPNIIVPFIREHNMGAQRNLIDLCQRAASPYIAFCEGDDYWTDKYKLQKQVSYMEEHTDLRACFAKAKIDAPADWFLRDYYKKDGELIYPDCEPKYKLPNRLMDMYDFIWFFPAHTSTVFYRWNYDLEIPEWFYHGIIGDLPIFLMQLGNGKTFYIQDVVSVYRRSNVGIFMSSNMDEHFLKTRLDHLRWMEGMLNYYAIHNITDYPRISIENRIKLEIRNFIKTALKLGDYGKIRILVEDYPLSTKIALDAYINFYDDSRALTAVYGWDGYRMAVRNRYYRRLVRPLVRAALFLKKEKDFLKGKVKNILSFLCYWRYTFTRKQKNIWVFSAFNKRGYLDNTKYLYEYVLEYHPEIRTIWMTLDHNVYEQLQQENKPVVMMRTPECRKILSRAAIAVTDHYRMSDYDAFSGLNDRTKIVQLWHGVGLKTIGDLKNTNVPGVMLSDDILPKDSDNPWQKILKKVKYFRHAYYRELFEHYFMLVCPGQERVSQVAEPLHIPMKNCFMSGHPRNILLHQTHPDPDIVHILYAPTYRWSAVKEQHMVQQIIDAAEMIQERMCRINGYLTIRLHPHTWRNYNSQLSFLTQQYDRILLDTEKDIYQTLGRYRILISDYSSISYDFILLNRPVIFFNYDFEDFVKTECKINYDYDAYSPGTKTQTWEQTLTAVEEYLFDSKKDSAWRCRVRDEFYDMSVNDKANSERIVAELKKRLGIA